MEDQLSLTGKVLLVAGGILLVTGGIIGFQQAASPAQTGTSEGPEGEESGSCKRIV
ncbi:MAG: hypothetical protein J07AB43_10290 [Candidatus Nanosalina sp. J07AB43]|nr:MAG: hypothetical protein J07AB43_10290 [Candidatus Nanosalina sp. J07AB43]